MGLRRGASVCGGFAFAQGDDGHSQLLSRARGHRDHLPRGSGSPQRLRQGGGGRFARGHRFAGRADLLKRSFAGGHGHEGHPCRRSDFGHQGGAHRRDHSPRP